ncbi:MAG: hypothetical protein Q9215_008263 [Flavoplaca cf. flavocitrina]
MSEFLSSQDYRLSWGSNAPEVDNTRSVPECRPDRAGPEVVPGSGVQVIYDDLPPEAVATHSVENLSTKDAQNIRPTKKVINSIIAVAVAVAAGLGIGLGVGLHRRQVVPPPRELNISSTPTPTPTPTQSPHALMQNTPISAVTLNNTNRHLYFREQTGAVRRAIYVAQAQRWLVDVDARPLSNAKNDAPIAVVPLPDEYDDVALLYVNSTNQLDCADWEGRKGGPLDGCSWILHWPITNVAPESIPISAAVLKSYEGEKALLLTYQNTTQKNNTQKPVLLLGYYNKSTDSFPEWTWQDETDKLKTVKFDMPMVPELAELPLTACRVTSPVDLAESPKPGFDGSVLVRISPSLYCVHDKDSWLLLVMEYVSPGNLSIHSADWSGNNSRSKSFSDMAWLAAGGPLVLNQSNTLSSFTDLPGPPEDRIPFDHIASTYATTSDRLSYVYYQLDDSTFAERAWDEPSGTWIPNNVTIDTA